MTAIYRAEQLPVLYAESKAVEFETSAEKIRSHSLAATQAERDRRDKA
jgi:hypothetical protein